MYYAEQKPSKVHYLCDQKIVMLKILKESVNITLDKHAPLYKKYVRANQSPFIMNKRNHEKVTLEKQIFKYKK